MLGAIDSAGANSACDSAAYPKKINIKASARMKTRYINPSDKMYWR